MQVTKIVIIGCGGIGTHLVRPLCQYLAYKHPNVNIILRDGDNFEPPNADRQIFRALGNKAEVTAAELHAAFPMLSIEAKPRFVTPDNVFVYLTEGSYVFSCVDNFPTRKLLSEHCAGLADVVLISGGNDFDDGNIQLYIRQGSENVTHPLTHLHPEIENPKGKNPADMSCEERAAAGTPQLIFANLKVATEMAGAFYMVTQHFPRYNELYFDLKTGAQRAVLRKET